MLTTRVSYLVRKLKNIKPQSWIIHPADATQKFQNADLSDLGIKYYSDTKKELKRGLQQQPKPISPVQGPITVYDPVISDKIYRWCACGLSFSQPFCDGSHRGSLFKPYKFTIEEPVKSITLCGCKMTTKKPFCDGTSCKLAHQ